MISDVPHVLKAEYKSVFMIEWKVVAEAQLQNWDECENDCWDDCLKIIQDFRDLIARYDHKVPSYRQYVSCLVFRELFSVQEDDAGHQGLG